jgi:replicative DNA helicase
MQAALAAAEAGTDAIVFSLEMGADELIAKCLSRMTFINSKQDALTVNEIMGRDVYESGNAALNLAVDSFKKSAASANLYFVERTDSANGIGAAVARHILALRRKPIVFVDYLQILGTRDGMSDKQSVDGNVLELKRLSRDNGIPVVAASSLNRQNYKAAVSMPAFKESGIVEYSSDVLIGLQLDGTGARNFDINAAMSKPQRNVNLVVLKNRNGQAGGVVNFIYNAKFNCFSELGSTKELPSANIESDGKGGFEVGAEA